MFGIPPEIVATAVVDSSGKFQASFIAPDLGAVVLTAIDNSGVTAGTVY